MINNREKVDVLIVTVADDEDVAVRNIIAETWNEIPRLSKSDLWVDMVRVKSKKGNSFSIGLVRVPSMGTDGTGDAVATLIQQLTPTCIAMCGICAGHPDDTELGDVIIARDVFRYDSKSVKRIDSETTEENLDIVTFTMAPPWIQLAQRLSLDGIKIHIGSIGTGNILWRDPNIWKNIERFKRKNIGLEMEASVMGYLGHAHEIRWLVIKGVSDHANPQKDDSFHSIASERAARVLFEFLQKVAEDFIQSTKSVSHTALTTKDEIFQLISSCTPDDFECQDGETVQLLCIKNINLVIKITRLYEEGDFSEGWVKKFQDQSATRVKTEICFNNSRIDELIYVDVDGGRYILPMPKSPCDLRIEKKDYHLALIINCHCTTGYGLDTGLERAGISVIE